MRRLLPWSLFFFSTLKSIDFGLGRRPSNMRRKWVVVYTHVRMWCDWWSIRVSWKSWMAIPLRRIVYRLYMYIMQCMSRCGGGANTTAFTKTIPSKCRGATSLYAGFAPVAARTSTSSKRGVTGQCCSLLLLRGSAPRRAARAPAQKKWGGGGRGEGDRERGGRCDSE